MNKRGFANVRVGHAGAHPSLRKRDSCQSGGFYINPTAGMTVSSSDSFNISWDASCMSNTQAVDIYLMAPALPNSRIHEWQNVNFGLGSYQTTLEPRWWNDSSSVSLQLSIVPSGNQPFLSEFPAAPVFTATYTAPTSGSTPAGADMSTPDTVTYVNNFPTNSSLSKGKIAAGILIPLFFIGLGVAAYIKLSRAKGKEKRKRFSEAVDKRMSTISTDWKSISAAGATAAIRNSIAVSTVGNRSSAFTFGAIRPASSAMAVEGDWASTEKTPTDDVPNISHIRPGLRASAFGERVSRVSFAADVRPSMESRRTVATHPLRSSVLPPLPTRSDSGDLSPTQTTGPFSLTPEDIQARISGDPSPRPSMDEVWPSLSMMRTGNGGENSGDDFLLPPNQESMELPLPPVPARPGPDSPVVGMMPMPASVMSPDEMLRAYAERKMTSPPPTGPIAFPTPSASYNGTGMRTLYSPSAPSYASSIASHVKQTSGGDKRYTSYSEVDPYSGTA
ncbi:hypothetical protein PAXINDRAFT_68947 [Paxillus involutus ATCC 200175]|nr:hypothetical protein PAXINDRAFT_68947 [Paxillus involutus ATCC 200175]